MLDMIQHLGQEQNNQLENIKLKSPMTRRDGTIEETSAVAVAAVAATEKRREEEEQNGKM